MRSRLALAGLLTVALAFPAATQTSRNLSIRPDLRLFAMMMAVNAAGFDVELASEYHPVRQLVRDAARNLQPDLVARLKDYYTRHKGNQTDEAQLAKYISLAVNLTDPPEFGLLYKEEALPPDARSVSDFVPLLREVYTQARLPSLWAQLRPQYEVEIERMSAGVREALLRADAYMRLPLGRVSPREMTIYVELAAPINSVHVRSYQDHYHVVLGAATSPKLDDIRHAYLHFQLDQVVAANVGAIEGATTLLPMLKGFEGIERAYTSDLYVMVVESLIRALELRLDEVPDAEAETAVRDYYRSGLLLTPYFHEALPGYERADATLPDHFPTMAKAVRIAREQERFATQFAQIPVPERLAARAEVPAPPEPEAGPAVVVRDLLRQGQEAFNRRDMAAARKAFSEALSQDPGNGAALYGLALIASSEGLADEARDYLTRTIASANAEPAMTVWAHIYLGRIFDLECDRDKALEHYNRAIAIGDNTRNAQTAAQDGLKRPYGDACRAQD